MPVRARFNLPEKLHSGSKELRENDRVNSLSGSRPTIINSRKTRVADFARAKFRY